MNRRRLALFVLIGSTLLMGVMAVSLSLWRVVPQWEVGQWSLRVQFMLTHEASCEDLLRAYNRALDNGYSHSLNEWLAEKLAPGHSTLVMRTTVIRFFALRAARARHPDSLCKHGPEMIGEVLEATAPLGPSDKRSAVMLMESLRQRLALKLFWGQEDDGTVRMNQDEMGLRAWSAFETWWHLPPSKREESEPLEGTGIEIGSP